MAEGAPDRSLPHEVTRRLTQDPERRHQAWRIGGGVQQLNQLRESIQAGSVLHIVDMIPPLGQPRLTDRLRGLGSSGPTGVKVDDLVPAVRAAGFTIASIERFEVDVDGTSQQWVDLQAIVLDDEASS